MCCSGAAPKQLYLWVVALSFAIGKAIFVERMFAKFPACFIRITVFIAIIKECIQNGDG
jgi:hypothetical protein